MNLESLLKTSPSTLAKTQHDALKQHAMEVLAGAMAAITNENYNSAKKLTFTSPAGDCMGIDSEPIEFSYGTEKCISFGEIVSMLSELKSTYKK